MVDETTGLETKLNEYSKLPDLTDSSSYIVILKHAITKTMGGFDVCIGRDREHKGMLSITELLDPNGCFLFWVVSTLMIMRPLLLKSMPEMRGYTVYIESSDESSLDYRVQAIACDSAMDLINPMVEALARCFDEKSQSIIIDDMVRHTYLWFQDHGYPINQEGSIAAFFNMTRPETFK